MALCVSLRNWREASIWWDILWSKRDVDEDRLSELPEALTLKILALLPTREAIATGVLSKQWQSRWKMLPKLEFCFGGESREFGKFSRNVRKVLLTQKALVLESVQMRLRFDASNSMDARMMIRIALSRNLRQLSLEFTTVYGQNPRWFKFPKALYNCATLETLKIMSIGLREVPCSSSVRSLKSLTTLSLDDVDFQDEESVAKLFSCCPNLQDLVFKRRVSTTLETFTISVPSLERLTIYDCGHGELRRGYVINAPCLKYLKIDFDGYVDGHIKFFLFENATNKLVEANLKVVSKITNEKLLLSDLTSVKRLSLNISTSTINLPTDNILHQLVYLELHTDVRGWRSRVLFMLDSSPKLQALKLIDQLGMEKEDPAPFYWYNPPDKVPECLLFHLETFIWEGYRWKREDEILMAKFILSNANRLKKATFFVFVSIYMDLEKRAKMAEHLNTLPRASNSCQLFSELIEINIDGF